VAVPLFLLIAHFPFLFGAAKPVPIQFHRLKYREFGGAIVGMIGPVTNLAIAAIAGLLFKIFDPQFGTTVYEIFRLTIMLNIGLFLFNSIPWPPLDGSRLLYAFAPRPLQEVMEAIERAGIAGLALLMLLIYQLPAFSDAFINIFKGLVHLVAPGLII